MLFLLKMPHWLRVTSLDWWITRLLKPMWRESIWQCTLMREKAAISWALRIRINCTTTILTMPISWRPPTKSKTTSPCVPSITNNPNGGSSWCVCSPSFAWVCICTAHFWSGRCLSSTLSLWQSPWFTSTNCGYSLALLRWHSIANIGQLPSCDSLKPKIRDTTAQKMSNLSEERWENA